MSNNCLFIPLLFIEHFIFITVYDPPSCLMGLSTPVCLFKLRQQIFTAYRRTKSLSTFSFWKSRLCWCSAFVARNHKRRHHCSTPNNAFDIFCYLYHQSLRHLDKNITSLINLDDEQSMHIYFPDCRARRGKIKITAREKYLTHVLTCHIQIVPACLIIDSLTMKTARTLLLYCSWTFKQQHNSVFSRFLSTPDLVKILH